MTGQEFYTYILHSNLINFLIMLSILVLIFKKANLGSFINILADNTKNSVNKSAQEVQTAFSEYKKTKKESKTLDNKKEEIMQNAKQIAEKLTLQSEQETLQKQEVLENNFQKFKTSHLKQKTQNITEELQSAIYEVALTSVKKMMNDKMQKKLILDSLDELDKIEGAVK